MSEKKQMRSATPTPARIVKHWTSDVGLLHLRGIEDRLGLDQNKLVLKMVSIEHDDPACMACGQVRGAWGSLERCHILGVHDAHSAGLNAGDISDPSNFIMMCRKCHVESPTSADPDVFWMWFAHKQTKQTEFFEMTSQLIDQFGPIIFASAVCASMETPPYPVEGTISIAAMRSLFLTNIIKVKKNEISLVSVEEANEKLTKTLTKLTADIERDEN